MVARTFYDILIECITGNIVMQPDMDVIVNAANAELRMGGGVAGVIHRAAGPGLEEECRPLAPIRPGQAVITGAHGLPNRAIIHCLGPVYGIDKPSEKLLASCYSNAISLADQNKYSSIAFPAISTGAFGYPMAPAARIAIRTIVAMGIALTSLNHIRFVLFTEEDLHIHDNILMKL